MKDNPRYLTETEIDDIIEFSIPETNAGVDFLALENHEKLKLNTKKQLMEIQIKPSKIERLKKIIKMDCLKAFIHAGENVGLLCADSISEPLSQENLDSFHVTGVKGENDGGTKVVKEVLSIVKNRKNPKVYVHLKDKFLSELEFQKLRKIFFKVDINTLLDKRIKYEFLNSTSFKFPSYYKAFSRILEKENPDKHALYLNYVYNIEPNKTFLRLHFNTSLLFFYRITCQDIARELEKLGSVLCIFSPTHVGVIDLFVTNLNDNLKTQKKIQKNLLLQNSYSSLQGIQDITRPDQEEAEDDFIESASEVYMKDFTEKNKANLYLQTCVLVEILNNKLFIISDIIKRQMIKYGFHFTGMDFKDVEVVKVNLLECFHNEVYLPNFKKHFLWINDIACNKNGIEYPRDFETMFKLAGIKETEYIYHQDFNCFIFHERPVFEFLKNKFNTESKDYFKHTRFVTFTERKHFRCYQHRHVSQNKHISMLKNQDEVSEKNKNAFESLTTTSFKNQNYSFDENFNHVSNILNYLRSMVDFIDFKYIYSNNFFEVFLILGIEAVYNLLLVEINNIINKEKTKNFTVNPVHIKMIINSMTAYGFPTGITYNANLYKNVSAYYESSFQQALQSFKRAALGGIDETVNNVSSSVLFGKRGNFGTGVFKVISKDKENVNEPDVMMNLITQDQKEDDEVDIFDRTLYYGDKNKMRKLGSLIFGFSFI